MKRYLFISMAAAVLLNAAPAVAAPIQWPTNGHYYDLIKPDPALIWTDALTAAAGQSFDPDGPGGNPPLAGYLATITSQGEQDFINSQFQFNNGPNSQGAPFWISGENSLFASNGDSWTWQAGPETGQPLLYFNWLVPEPNHLNSLEPYIIANWVGTGMWNDYAADVTGFYLVEFDGRIPDPTVPEPFTALLVGTGLAGAAIRRKFFKPTV